MEEDDDLIVEDKSNEYECDTCGFSGSNDNLIEHILAEHSIEVKQEDLSDEEVVNLFMCGLCYESSYETIEQVKKHMIKVHNMREKKRENTEDLKVRDDEVIEKLKEDFLKPMSLRDLKMKLTGNWIRCPLKGCIYKFENAEKLNIHLKCHSKEEVRFKCSECPGGQFKIWRLCGQHMWKVHKIDVDLLKCILCPYKALTTVKIFKHLQIVHGSRKEFQCMFCPKTFPQYSQLRNHSIVHMEIKQSPITRWYSQKTCNICFNVFATSKTLSKHMRRHNKIMSYRCNICGKPSASKAIWLIHMRQHTGEKPLECNVCDFNARDPSVLRKHMMRHSETKPYKCKHCVYSSIQAVQLKYHIRTNHPEEYETIVCSLCPFSSINKELLARHLRDHKAGLVKFDDEAKEGSNNTEDKASKLQDPKPIIEVSSDCFLPLESMDSAHDPVVDIGGVTIPAEDTQFTIFNSIKNS